ncbi:AIM24 family protein [Paenibacillus sp. TRM 82003]|nr:AIM24 family protein [Paenibacillus sp. TRM 82003]
MIADQPTLAELRIVEGETVHVLQPSQIAAFRGLPMRRKDRLLRLGDMYRKKKWLESVISGPASVWIGVPRGFSHRTLEIGGDSDLLFLFRNVLYYSGGMRMDTRWLSARKAFATGDWLRVRFGGPGTLGLVSSGPLYEVRLDPHEPAYIDTRCLVAFPESATLRPAVYGNTVASQHMHYQWEIVGTGAALVQSCVPNARLEEATDHDSFVRRILREVVPFGGVIFK